MAYFLRSKYILLEKHLIAKIITQYYGILLDQIGS